MNLLLEPPLAPDDDPIGSVGAPVGFVHSSSELADQLVQWVCAPLTDPFASQLVVCPGGGPSRWLSQQIGLRTGICAGIDFLSPAIVRRRLEHDLLQVDPLTDPWSRQGLALRLSALVEQVPSTGWGEPLHHHLEPQTSGPDPRLALRPGRQFTTASNLAGLFLHYLRRMPELIAAWDQGSAVDAAGQPLEAMQRWQYELFSQVRTSISAPDPHQRHRQLVDALRHAPSGIEWARLAVAGLGRIEPWDRELIHALSRAAPTRIWQLDRVSNPTASLHRLSEGLRLQVDGWADTPPAWSAGPVVEPATTLARLQAAIAGAGLAPGPQDESISFHACHSDERQVQVLRDLLCAHFEADPSLEPRDVVIVVPDLPRFAPLVQAQFDDRSALGQPTGQAHPGRQLRVQLPRTATSGTSSVLDLVAAVLQICGGRPTAEDLVELCLARPLAHRFGLTPEDADTIRRLIGSSAMKWGLDRSDRVEAGLAEVGQGTLLSGVERLVAGAVLAEDPLTWIGSALPVGQLEPQDLVIVGVLAELISRLRKTRLDCSMPAAASAWAARLEEIIDRFADLPFSEQWAVGAARSAIRRWAAKASPDAGDLDLSSVRRVVRDLGDSWSGRPTFGNGNLLVVGLDDLSGVPHRVVAVLGLDDRSFPLRASRHGNDLLTAVDQSELPTQVRGRLRETDRRVASQAALVDALLNAGDQVLITYQGFDHRTGEALDPPVSVAEIAHVVDQLRPDTDTQPTLARHHHQLHAHAPDNYLAEDDPDRGPGLVFSFDPAGLQGARALAEPTDALIDLPAGSIGEPISLREWRAPAPLDDPGSLADSADAPIRPLSVVDLVGFYRHPARAFLTSAVGTSLGRFEQFTSEGLPIELYGLDAYQVGSTMLDQLRAGVPVDQAVMAARLGGAVPPGVLGGRAVEEIAATTSKMAAVLQDIPGAQRDLPIDLRLGQVRLTGSVRVTGQTLVDVSYSQLNGANLVGVWLRLLALASMHPGHWSARIVHKDARRLELTAPAAERTTQLLTELVQRQQWGLNQVLLAPLRTVFIAAKEQGIWRHTEHRRYDSPAKTWRQERDADWSRFAPESAAELFRTPIHPQIPTTVGQLAGWLFEPISAAVI